MGRLENILARNRRRSGFQERVVVSMVLGGIILLIIALAVFTDLGLPPEARDAPKVHNAPEPRSPAVMPTAPPGSARHVDGVFLVRPRPHK